MLKISGKTKLVLSTLSKLIIAMLAGCTSLLAILFTMYNPTYEVKLNGESLGHVSNKSLVQKRIDDFIQNGDAENVGYVILKDKPEYEFALVKKDLEISDDEVISKVIDACDVYYRVYGINVGGEEEFVVETVEEAQQISDKINEEQKDYVEKQKIEISEKFVKTYDLVDDIEVAVNDIVEEIEEENAKIIKKSTTYAASTKVVAQEILLALRESNAELNFRNPLDSGVITSRYGLRSLGNHKGLDIAAPTGTPIHASEAGIVTYSGWMNGYGNLLIVQHPAGYETYYGHCSKLAANVGDSVEKGDVIGYVGSTGRSTGPHVHLEIRIDGVIYNPMDFLDI